MSIRLKILKQAHHLFVKDGIRNVTMDQLAQSLGMSKRTIYEQFSDKRELIKEDAKHFAIELRGEANRILEEADNVIQGIARMMQYFTAVVQQVTPSYFADMKKFYPKAYEMFSGDSEIRHFYITNKLISKGVEQGVFRPDINIKLVSFFVNNTLLNNHKEMKQIEGLKFGDFEKDVLFAYLLGIATEEGRILIEKEQALFFEQMTMMGGVIPKYHCK